MTLYEETTIWNWAPYFGPRLVTSITDLSELLIPSYDFSFYSPRCLFFSIVCKCWFYLLPIKSSQKNSRWEHEVKRLCFYFWRLQKPFSEKHGISEGSFGHCTNTKYNWKVEEVDGQLRSHAFVFCFFVTFVILSLLVCLFACFCLSAFLAAFEILNLLVCFLCHLYHYESSRLIYNIFWLLVFFTVCFLATFDILSLLVRLSFFSPLTIFCLFDSLFFGHLWHFE